MPYSSRWLLVLLASISVSTSIEASQDHRRIIVGDGGPKCSKAQFSRIQDAIDEAAPGDSIHVCGGVYAEQLKITKSLELESNYDAILAPARMQLNATNLTTGQAVVAVVYASNARDINIHGLTFDAHANGITSCDPHLIGVYFQNASGVLKWLRVRNVRLGQGLEDCQSGTGIFVQSGKEGKSF